MRSIIYYNDSLAELHDMDLLISSGDVKPSLLSFPALVATIFHCSLPCKVYQGTLYSAMQAHKLGQCFKHPRKSISQYHGMTVSL